MANARNRAPKCVFLNTYYPGFLESHYRAAPGLESLTYAAQKASLQGTFFGDSDFYSRGLAAAGWEAEDLIANCDPLQLAWARENGLAARGELLILEQIRALAPDVVYLQDLNMATRGFLEGLRPLTRIIAGQIASPVPPQAHLQGLDLIVTSFPHFAAEFRARGLDSVYQPLAFDARVLDRVAGTTRIHPVTFVGGISPSHAAGTAFLERLASLVPIRFWGYGKDSLPPDSPIRPRHEGEAWGERMFRLLAGSRITVNRHIDAARGNANNMRLFEATGCGALLITDYKDNLHELFEIGKEVVAYRSAEECAALVEYYLGHPDAAAGIARAGQERTLREHSYLNRMAQTAGWLAERLERLDGRAPAKAPAAAPARGEGQADAVRQALSSRRPEAAPDTRRHYVTLFDRNYLTRGIALAHSLAKHEARPYVLNAVCLDEISRLVLEALAIPGVKAVPLHDVEKGDAALLAARADRSLVEYYWTLTPTIIRWVMEAAPAASQVTYLDSDLYFFSSPDPVFAEMGEDSVLIHGHRFTPELEQLAADNGIYNVGLLSFRRDGRGRAALEWWRERCLEWCKAVPENGKMGDQKYLDDWPRRFPGVRVLEHVGAGLAPWNLAQYRLEPGSPPRVDGLPVVFFHFHALAMPSREVVVPVKHPHYALTPESLALLYVPYAAALRAAIAEAVAHAPSFAFGFQDKGALQSGSLILARPEAAISGAENIPKAALPGGWICFLTPQLRIQPERRAPQTPILSAARASATTAPPVPAPREASPVPPDGSPLVAPAPVAKQPGPGALGGHAGPDSRVPVEAGGPRDPSAALAAAIGSGTAGARAWTDLAMARRLQGDYAGALSCLCDALKIDPRYRPALMNLADLKLSGKAFEPARDLLLCYLDGFPDDWEVRAPLIAAEAAEFDRMISEGELSLAGWQDREYEITALVSTYKSEAFIEEALTDLEAQSAAGGLEIIVVDAASPENERAVVERFQRRYGNIRYLRTRERIGIYPAWNLAARMAKGRYLTPMSTNDRLAPDAYEVLLEALRANPGAALAYGDSHLTPDPHQTFARFRPSADYGGRFAWPPYDYDDLIMNCRVGPHPVWRRGLHAEIGWFDGRYKAIGDQDFWLRIALKHPLVHVPKVTGLAWITKESLSGEASSYQEIVDIHRKHASAYLERERAKAAAGLEPPGEDWSPATGSGAVFLPPKYAVTAVVSTFASERHMRGCLENLVSQTLFLRGDMEIVVVDSGSPQGERAIVEEYQRSHERILYVRSDRETIYAAWNRAVLSSRGRLLVNANADDRHRRDAFEIMSRALESAGDGETGPGLAYCDALLTKGENETFERNGADRVWSLPDWNVRQALIDCPFGCTVMWRRSLHAALGLFDEAFRIAGDYEFFFKAALARGALHVRQALTLYFESPASLSHDPARGVDAEVHRFLSPYRRGLPLSRIYPFLGGDPAAEAIAAVDLASWLLDPMAGRVAPDDALSRLDRAFAAAGPGIEILSGMIVAGARSRREPLAKAALAYLVTHEPAFAASLRDPALLASVARSRLSHPGLEAMPRVVPVGETRVPIGDYAGDAIARRAEGKRA